MTSPERWQRLEKVFQAALDVPLERRDAFLRDTCGDDEDLRSETASLLALDNDDGDTESPRIASIIEGTAAALFDGPELDSPELDSMVGVELGRYRILREIGRGGMGAVYLAIRADRAFDMQVAIKLVKRGIDTDAVLQRFWHERRILAALDHPFIARLIDGGTSPDGRPYFVMEYVDGHPLDRYARESNLSVPERCELFRKICEAVSYAHRNLVIHRDIKPANILVTSAGTPKLLDFGIARLLSIEPGDLTIAGSLIGGHAMTPEFASPEQLKGLAVTTATDVYSLGATLRALLAGFKLPSDLATIVNKATRQESDQRFASVADLSEDVRRYLGGLPIQARDQTWLYLSARFVRRHRASVALFVLLNIFILSGILLLIRESRQATRERMAAEQRLSQAVEIANRTLADVTNSMAELPGATEARRQLVRNTLEYLDRLAKDSGNDPRVLTALATAYTRVGEVLGNTSTSNLGDLPGALATYRKANQIVSRLRKAAPGDPNLQSLAAVVHQGTANILESGDSDVEAEKEYRLAVAIADRLLADHPDDLNAQFRSIDCHISLAMLLYVSRPADAEVDARKQLPLAVALVNRQPGNLDAQTTLSNVYSLLGTALNRNNHTPEAIEAYRKALEIRERQYRQHPRNANTLHSLMLGYGHVADILGSPLIASQGDYKGALEYYRKAARIAEEMSSADPSDMRARYDVGMVWTRIGATAYLAGQTPAASLALDKAVERLEPLVKSNPGITRYARGFALTCEFRGKTCWREGDRKRALYWLRRSLAVIDRFSGSGPLEHAVRTQQVLSEGPMSVLVALDGDGENALRLARKAIQQSVDLSRTSLSRSWDWHGQTQEALNDFAGALVSYNKSLEIWKTVPGVAVSPSLEAEIRATQKRAALCRRKVAP